MELQEWYGMQLDLFDRIIEIEKKKLELIDRTNWSDEVKARMHDLVRDSIKMQKKRRALTEMQAAQEGVRW